MGKENFAQSSKNIGIVVAAGGLRTKRNPEVGIAPPTAGSKAEFELAFTYAMLSSNGSV